MDSGSNDSKEHMTLLRNKANQAILTLVAAAATVGGAWGAPPSWNGYRGPNRDGVSADANWAPWTGEKPRILWTAQVGPGYSTVVVLKGRAYTMGNKADRDIVYCMNAETGKEIWTFPYDCPGVRNGFPGPRAATSVDDKYVFTVSWQGQLHCLDVRTGKKVWARTMQDFGCTFANWGCACAPLIHGNRVIYDLGKIVALDKATGKKIWETKDFTSGYSSPVAFDLNGGTCVAAFPATALVVLDAADGRVVSTYPWQTQGNATVAMPVVVGDRLFVSSGYKRGCALVRPTAGEAEKVWRNKNMSNHVNTCVLHEGHVYGFDGQVGSGVNRLRCINIETGEATWT